MAKATELPFEVCTRVGPLDGSPDPHMQRNNSEGGGVGSGWQLIHSYSAKGSTGAVRMPTGCTR